MSDLINTLFNGPFGQVRTAIREDGNPLFCGKDVATILGYIDTNQAIRKNCRYPSVRLVGVQTGTYTDGSPVIQTVNMTFITESDMYRLITRSKLPQAQQFEKWVYEDVLPSIRKYGFYQANIDAIDPNDYPQLKGMLDQDILLERDIFKNKYLNLCLKMDYLIGYLDTLKNDQYVKIPPHISRILNDEYDDSCPKLNN